MAWEMTLQNTFLDFVNFTLTAGWVILAVLILRVILTRVPKKYVCLLWFVVLFRLLCPVTVETVLSVVPQPSTITYEDVAYTTPKIETGSTMVNTIADYTVNPVMEAYLAPVPQSSVNPMQVYLFIASILWVAGIVAIGLYTIISWARMALRLRESVPEDGYYRCANIQSPFVFGLLKPKIYIPYGLDGEAKEYVLLHEKSHIARKDFLVKPIFWLAVMVHWMNPMVWIAWHYFSRDLELACDERAIDALDKNQKSDYSNTLLSLAVQPKYFSCPVAFGNNSVKERITHVLHYKRIPALARDTICILMVLAAVLLVVNPLKAGPLSDFEPKLLEEYPYGLNSVHIQYGVVNVNLSDAETTIINSEKALAFREWLANVKVQKIPTEYKPGAWETANYINITGVKEYQENHVTFDTCNFTISKDFSEIYPENLYDYALKIKNPEAFREMILSYSETELQSYPDTTFYADLNHDGEDERIIVKPRQEEGAADIAVYKQDGALLFGDYLNYARSGWDNYFLYEKDGKEYLMQFQPSMNQGYANYSWKLYEFDEKNQMVTVEENGVGFSINPNMHDFDTDAIYRFLQETDEMLHDAMVLVSVEHFNLCYSTADEPKMLSIAYYLNWLEDGAERGHLAEQLQEFYQNDIYEANAKMELLDFICGSGELDESQYILANPQHFQAENYYNIEFISYELRDKTTNEYIDSYAISADRAKRNIYLGHLKFSNGQWVWGAQGAEVYAIEDHLGKDFK